MTEIQKGLYAEEIKYSLGRIAHRLYSLEGYCFYIISANENEDGEVLGTYICVRYELCDGTKVVLFATDSFSTRKILDNYYKLYKEEQKKSNA